MIGIKKKNGNSDYVIFKENVFAFFINGVWL